MGEAKNDLLDKVFFEPEIVHSPVRSAAEIAMDALEGSDTAPVDEDQE